MQMERALEDEIPPVDNTPAPIRFENANPVEQTASDAFGVGFEDLLSIVLTQLTFQDPLKPVDNFEFVSQLAQFTQIQQTETLNDNTLSLLETETTSYAAGLLGRTVDVPAGSTVLSGRVTSIALQDGFPTLTIETSNEQVISNIALNSISQVREGDL